MQLPNGQQIKFGTEHVISTVAGIMGTLGAIGALDPETGKALVEGLNQIGEGIGKIVAGVSALVVTGTAIIASLRGNPIVQMITGSKAVAKNPELAAEASQLSTVDKTAIAQGAVAIAANSDTANRVLLENVVDGLPNVQGIVTDKTTALASPNRFITANPSDIPKAA